jgi:hypothetical protein
MVSFQNHLASLTIFFVMIFSNGCATTKAQSLPTSNGLEKTKTEIAVEAIEEKTEKIYELPLVVIPEIPKYELSGNEYQSWINKNEPAPFSGIILTPEAMSQIITLYLSQRDIYELTIKKQHESDFEILKIETGKLMVEMDSQKKKSDTRLAYKEKEIQRLQEINKDISKAKSNILRDILFVGGGVGVGLIAGVVIMAVAN